MHWFLSYNSRDRELASLLRAALAAADKEHTFFFDQESLFPGHYWLPRLAEEIGAADAFVLVLGPAGIGGWQELEYYEAFDRRAKDENFPVIPLVLPGAQLSGLAFLRQLHWVIADGPAGSKTVAQLLDAAQGQAAGQTERKLWRYVKPYRGLPALNETDSEFFFGRDAETQNVLARLAEAADRVPVLIGNSGVGKSSVAMAGVVGALKRQRFATDAAPWPTALQDSRRWCYIRINPGTDAIAALVGGFWKLWDADLTNSEEVKRKKDWIEDLRAGTLGVADLMDATEDRIAKRGDPPPPAFLLYVDQGEETYLQGSHRAAAGRLESGDPDKPDTERRIRFSELLADGARDLRLRAFMSLRADYYGALQADQALRDVRDTVDIEPLDRTMLETVITGPVKALNVRFADDKLPSSLAANADQAAGSLPLLSYLLDDMWGDMQKRRDGELRLPYAAVDLGGVLASRGDAYLEQPAVDRDVVRRLFTLKLVHLEDKGEPLRRRCPLAELEEDERTVVQTLANEPHRLLVTTGGEKDAPDEGYVEVAHEAVLRDWATLKSWLTGDEGRQKLLEWLGQTRRALKLYDEAPAGKKEEALLTGYALEQARAKLIDWDDEIPAAERVFVDKSIAADDRVAEIRQKLLDRYEVLKVKPRLEEAKRQESELYPAWPERREALDEWLRTMGEPFAEELPRLQHELEELRELAEPWTDKERVRDLHSHPRFKSWEDVSNRRDELATRVKDSSSFGAFDEKKAAEDELATLEAEVLRLKEETHSRSTWSFADQGDQFIHDTLALLVTELREFAAGNHSTLVQVREHLEWASSVEKLSISDHERLWEQARWSITKADGQNASERYGEHPIELDPQIGLVPIGMNPRTRLWEFYHLRSAGDPRMIPENDKEACIAVGEHTGIVFVLIPGGTFVMGAQKDDVDDANYYELAQDDEKPHEVRVKPYFLARHQMTQAQWKRLSGGEEPSFYREGQDIRGDRRPIMLTRPVEQVSWTMCQKLLAHHGLALPTEEQWEYGCRAGTETPWSTGLKAKTLSGFANIADATAKGARVYWDSEESVVSEHVDTAPVGFYKANEFGLHDMHGNVWEWCQDSYHPQYGAPEGGPSSTRVYRGGSFRNVAEYARSALRHYSAPSNRTSFLGLRPARGITAR